eukprot:COSAG01_NODE_26309_length_718_cov_0.906300_1_plen_46_part_10
MLVGASWSTLQTPVCACLAARASSAASKARCSSKMPTVVADAQRSL